MSQLLALYMGSLILRSIGIALVAGICSRKIRNVAARHAVWVAVLGAVLLMPVVDHILPASWVPARIQQVAAKQPVSIRVASARATVKQPTAPAPAAVTLPIGTSPVNLWNVAATLYALAAFAMFVRLALGYRKVRKLRGTARAITSTVCEEIVGPQRTRWRIPVLLESESVQVPMTIGFRRPAIILPADWKSWDDWKMRAVLLHELAHVRRVDWGIAVVAAAAKCAYWLNPVSWVLERQLSQLAEQASDDATLSDIQNPTRYAEILLEFAITAQNGGRLVKGGVAMAQPNMKARIERALGNPKTGTGIVKAAGWTFLMFLAVPIMYSAAALQVTSEPVKPPVAAYAAEFGRSSSRQTPVAVPQAAPSPVPNSGEKNQQISPNPAADPQISYEQWDAKYEKVRRSLERIEQTSQKLQKYNQFNGGPVPEPQDSTKVGSAAFLQDQLKKMVEQLTTLQAAMQQQSQANASPLQGDALLNLPGNRDDLVAYLNQLASLRVMKNSFSVSFTRTQGRTIFMKVSEKEFSFGCESCSFFVGESVVSSATSAPPGPGVTIRLSPDGRELTVTCRATICNVGFEDGTGQLSLRRFVSGDSEVFAASELRSVVISKD